MRIIRTIGRNYTCVFAAAICSLTLKTSFCATGTLSVGTQQTTAASSPSDLSPVAIPGENIELLSIDPDIRAMVQSRGERSTTAPTRVVLYTLPNGNTLEQTFGRKEAAGLDWHYYIQHIGAQTRRVAELLPRENFVTVLLQAKEKSWPTWRKHHANSSTRIRELVEKLHTDYGTSATIDLVSHSGGGSFIFGLLNGVEQVPAYVRRIVFLDSNYAYDAAEGHAQKLWEWLNADPQHRLYVLSYDDRNIVLNGKPIVSPTGGTFRSTSRMSAEFESSTTLTVAQDRDIITSTGLEGRLRLAAHQNPDLKILHTVLVEKNGFVHALTSGTDAPTTSPEDFYADQNYRKWIR